MTNKFELLLLGVRIGVEENDGRLEWVPNIDESIKALTWAASSQFT